MHAKFAALMPHLVEKLRAPAPAPRPSSVERWLPAIVLAVGAVGSLLFALRYFFGAR